METFPVLLAICAGNSPVTGEFPTQRPGTNIFDVFFDQRLNNGWLNNGEAGDLRYYDVTVMWVVETSMCQSARLVCGRYEIVPYTWCNSGDQILDWMSFKRNVGIYACEITYPFIRFKGCTVEV